MQPADLLRVLCVVALTGIAAVMDLRTRRVPNVLTVSAFAAGLLFHLVVGAWQEGWNGAARGLGYSLGGFATGFAILLVLWLIGGGGGGDVKLMGAVGAWLGARQTLYVFIVSVALVAVGSLVWMLLRNLAPAWAKSIANVGTPEAPRGAGTTRGPLRKKNNSGTSSSKGDRLLVPYGVPLAVATWCVLAYLTINAR